MPKKKKKPSNLEEKVKNRAAIMTNFYIKRLTEVCHDPKTVWELTQNPDNIFRLTPQELSDVLAELDRRLLSGEITADIREKILQGINQ